jgi:hypothetical protein
MPDLARGTELHAMPSSLVMVGGSHAARMAGLMQSRLPSFTHGGWRPGFIAVDAMALDMKENVDSLPANAVTVLQLFDNVTYHAITTEDIIISCRKEQ